MNIILILVYLSLWVVVLEYYQLFISIPVDLAHRKYATATRRKGTPPMLLATAQEVIAMEIPKLEIDGEMITLKYNKK
jgi:hypothetical protein